MKKLLLSFLLVPAMAHAEITVVNPQARSSPTTVMAMSYQKSVPDSSFYQAENCQDGVKKFEGTPNSTIVYGTNLEITALRRGQSCLPKITKDNILFYGEQFYQICTKKGSNKTFRSPKATYGMASVQPVNEIVADINAQNGTSLVGLPFAGSRDVLLQVLSGDLDLGLIGTSVAAKHERAGDITCIASTDPRDKDFVGQQLKMKMPDIRIQTLIVHNIQDSKLVDKARRGLAETGFLGILKEGDFSNVKTQPSQELVDLTLRYINRANQAYGK